MGWDDNGLATERRVQNYFGVRCDPSLPVRPRLRRHRARAPRRHARSRSAGPTSSSCASASPSRTRRRSRSCSAGSACRSTGGRPTRRSARCRGGRRSGRSCGWCGAGIAYTAEAPTMWDVDFRTAVAQAEIEDREIAGTYHRIAFDVEDGDGRIEIETSRPELIPACVALVVNPADERYALARRAPPRSRRCSACRCPIVAHELADPEKGTGAAQICTFGDVTDVVWWRDLELAGSRDRAPRRHARRRTLRRAGLGVARSRRGERRDGRARGQGCTKQARKHDRRAAPRGRLARRGARAGAARREVLREGRSAARGHLEPPVVREDARPQGRAARARPSRSPGTRRSWARATRAGSRA